MGQPPTWQLPQYACNTLGGCSELWGVGSVYLVAAEEVFLSLVF